MVMFNEIDKDGEITLMPYLSKPFFTEIEDAEYLVVGNDNSQQLYALLKDGQWAGLIENKYGLQFTSLRESDHKSLLTVLIPVDDFELLSQEIVLLSGVFKVFNKVLESWKEQGCDVVMIDFERR